MVEQEQPDTTGTASTTATTGSGEPGEPLTQARRTRRRAAVRPAGPPQGGTSQNATSQDATSQDATSPQAGSPEPTAAEGAPSSAPADSSPGAEPPRGRGSRRAERGGAVGGLLGRGRGRGRGASAAAGQTEEMPAGADHEDHAPGEPDEPVIPAEGPTAAAAVGDPAAGVSLFMAPVFSPPAEPAATGRSTGRRAAGPSAREEVGDAPLGEGDEVEDDDAEESADPSESTTTGSTPARRRRRRGGRGRGRTSTEPGDASESAEDAEAGDADGAEDSDSDDAEDGDGDEATTSSRRRRRRRRRSSDSDSGGASDDPPNTVVRVREPRGDVGSVRGSTRLEAKKQRRREGREAGRRRTSILTESEFLARREAVERVMLVRQLADRTQIAVLEDGVLVEHYVNRATGSSMIGNVYLGRVQNVLPSMEAAFVDIGRGRNAVLYAGEVNWDAAGLEGQPRRIELALKSGDPVLVQVTKDPVGQKGARLTSQVSLPGRYLVYVPDGSLTGISRKLPDRERTRLKGILKKVMPEDAGVIVRTAAEGASEEALQHDIDRLTAQWAEISKRMATANPPTLLYGEPDLAIKVVRDIFNEDVTSMIVSGDGAWDTIRDYVTSVAPDLAARVTPWTQSRDLFAAHRIDEQLSKALDRKVWLPSGGSLVIDRTEAMTVVDVNTGKFTGQGGNLEETVTRNNLEAAEEIVRQLRLRDIGGIIVIDFIDMVLESNRDLVLRRLQECLGRDRTKHQVAEVTSLGLVQMTRKRIGQGLLEVFSEPCDHCSGRGLTISLTVKDSGEPTPDQAPSAGRRRRKVTGVDPADVAAKALMAASAADGAGAESQDGAEHVAPEHVGPEHDELEHVGPEHVGPEHGGPGHDEPDHDAESPTDQIDALFEDLDIVGLPDRTPSDDRVVDLAEAAGESDLEIVAELVEDSESAVPATADGPDPAGDPTRV